VHFEEQLNVHLCHSNHCTLGQACTSTSDYDRSTTTSPSQKLNQAPCRTSSKSTAHNTFLHISKHMLTPTASGNPFPGPGTPTPLPALPRTAPAINRPTLRTPRTPKTPPSHDKMAEDHNSKPQFPMPGPREAAAREGATVPQEQTHPPSRMKRSTSR
jgi:hypothetical protein